MVKTTLINKESEEDTFLKTFFMLDEAYYTLFDASQTSEIHMNIHKTWERKCTLLKQAQETKDLECLLALEGLILKNILQRPYQTPEAFSSVTDALDQFADAERALEALKNPEKYKAANEVYKIIPDRKSLPKDACQKFLASQLTRLMNNLKHPNLSKNEAKFLNMRRENLRLATRLHKDLQEKALSLVNSPT